MGLVQVGGTDLAYDEAGDGETTIVFVHAGLADRRMWDHQFHALAAFHRVIRYDQRGSGESGAASGDVAHYEDLLALLDALDVQRTALVGCSMGGQCALDVTLAAPGRVSALGLICALPSGLGFSEETIELMRAAARAAVPDERRRAYHERAAKQVDPADVMAMAELNVRLLVAGPKRRLEDLKPEVRERALEMCRGVFARQWTGPAFQERHIMPPALGRLREVSAPTLVITGQADIPDFAVAADLLIEGISDARRLDLPDTGHLPPLERPDRVTDALTHLLRDGQGTP